LQSLGERRAPQQAGTHKSFQSLALMPQQCLTL
jgi:hypothetical protein